MTQDEAVTLEAEQFAARLKAWRAIPFDTSDQDRAIVAANDLANFCDEHGDRILTTLRQPNGATQAASDTRLREALEKHHEWHLAQTDEDQHGIVPAEAYAESSLCDLTRAALQSTASPTGGEDHG